MTSATPIFDSLVDEFNRSGKYMFGYVYQTEEPGSEVEVLDIPVETPTNLKTHKTLLDATHLEAIKPAIPEYDKNPKRKGMSVDLVLLDEAVDADATQKISLADAPTTVMERLKEADKELGLDEWDEAFEKAAEKLPERPASVVTLTKKATPADLARITAKVKAGEIKPESLEAPKKLPRRRNKRNQKKPVNANAGFNFFETDTSDSPGSAA
jgi:hypothetical protein